MLGPPFRRIPRKIWTSFSRNLPEMHGRKRRCSLNYFSGTCNNLLCTHGWLVHPHIASVKRRPPPSFPQCCTGSACSIVYVLCLQTLVCAADNMHPLSFCRHLSIFGPIILPGAVVGGGMVRIWPNKNSNTSLLGRSGDQITFYPLYLGDN